jgi:hypothetical protein
MQQAVQLSPLLQCLSVACLLVYDLRAAASAAALKLLAVLLCNCLQQAARANANKCAAELTLQPASVRMRSPYWRTPLQHVVDVPQEPVMVRDFSL